MQTHAAVNVQRDISSENAESGEGKCERQREPS